MNDGQVGDEGQGTGGKAAETRPTHNPSPFGPVGGEGEFVRREQERIGGKKKKRTKRLKKLSKMEERTRPKRTRKTVEEAIPKNKQ